jgi:hypothetical protein
VTDPYVHLPPAQIFALAEAAPADGSIRIGMTGFTFDAKEVSSTYLLPLGAADADGFTRLSRSAGLELVERDGAVIVDLLTFGGFAEKMGIDFDWTVTVTVIDVEAERMPKEVFYIPALLLLALVSFIHRRRLIRTKPEEALA